MLQMTCIWTTHTQTERTYLKVNTHLSVPDRDDPAAFTAVAKHLIAHAQARLMVILLLIMCIPVSVASLASGLFTFGTVLAGLWLFLIAVSLLSDKFPARKSCPKPWRFQLADPDDFLDRLAMKAGLKPLRDGSAYAVKRIKGITVYFLLQQCSDVSKVNAVRKQLYRLIPADSRPDKRVRFPNKLMQLVIIAVDSDPDGRLPASIQNNADQLMGRAVPMLKIAVDRSSSTLYVPGLRESVYVGELKEYFHASRYILDVITESQTNR